MSKGRTDRTAQVEERYFAQQRAEVLAFVPPGVATALEIGCGEGAFGKLMKTQFAAEVWGVEPSAAAEKAGSVLDRVYHGNFEDFCLEYGESRRFDLLVFNDVLEHLVDPWVVLANCHKLLHPGGRILASIPNVRFYKNIKKLLFAKDWEYVDKGILDRTHLRFFTRKSMVRMFEECGYTIERIDGINRAKKTAPKLVNVLSGGFIEDMLFTQFVVVARTLR